MEALVCWGKIVKCVLGRLRRYGQRRAEAYSVEDDGTRTDDFPAWFGHLFFLLFSNSRVWLQAMTEEVSV